MNTIKDIFSGREKRCGLEVIKKLGSGSYGEVYKVIDNKGNIKAMKILKDSWSDVYNNIVEIDILSRFSHPHIISADRIFTDVSCKETKSLAYLMEYCSFDFYDFIKTVKNEMEGIKLINVMYQIALGVFFLHEVGIVHCDIKEENIGINTKGQIKILDFGASLYDFRQGKQDKDSRGTTHYIAPELVNFDRNFFYDYTCDTWAYAMIFLDLLQYKVGNEIYSGLSFWRKYPHTYNLFSDKNKTNTIENLIYWDSKVWKNVDINIIKDFLYFLIEDDKNLRPEFDQILNHPIFSYAKRNPELESREELFKYIYHYQFVSRINKNRDKKEIEKVFSDMIKIITIDFPNIDCKLIFLFHETFIRLLYNLDIPYNQIGKLALFISLNSLQIGLSNRTDNEITDMRKNKYLPDAIEVLMGILLENRVYNYCSNKNDLKKWFKIIVSDVSDMSIYQEDFMYEMMSKKKNKITDLNIKCIDFLIENYDLHANIKQVIRDYENY